MRSYRCLIAPLLLIAVGILLVLYFYNPSTSRFYPVCLFHSLTGFHCAGCGGLRAVHALLNGQLAESISYNPLLIIVGPLFLLALIAKKKLRLLLLSDPKREMRDQIQYFTPAVVITVIGYTILRNLPFPPFCHLAPH